MNLSYLEAFPNHLLTCPGKHIFPYRATGMQIIKIHLLMTYSDEDAPEDWVYPMRLAW